MAAESSADTIQDRPAPAATLSAHRPASPSPLPLPRLLPALATGGLFWLCHFPVACGWLAWVALVPLLCLVRSPARPWRIYLAAWAGGLVFFWPVLQWMRVADPRMYYTWAALATYCSLYFPLGIFLVRWLDRRTPLPLVMTVPAVWTALEFFRAYFGTGFAWYFLGHSQHDWLPVIQVADLAGVYAVTLLVAAVNALLFELLYARRWFRRLFALPAEPALPRRAARAVQAAAVILLLVATLAYGLWRLGQNVFDVGPRVALVQGNLEQGVRNARSSPGPEAGQAGDAMIEHYARLSDFAANQQPRPDLIVWPETSYPDEWFEFAHDLPAERVQPHWRKAETDGHDMARSVVRRWQTSALLGLNSRVLGADEKPRRYNSALLVEARPFRLELVALAGAMPQAGFPANLSWASLVIATQKEPPRLTIGQVAGRYDKIHRVPFGEYVPFRESLPFMNAFAPYDFDYSVSAGEQMTRFVLGGHRFGVLICYEDTDPYLARQYVRRGQGSGARGQEEGAVVDFLLNISNDGWFDGTSEHEEHLAICRFRAVECRRSIARAVNMGISAVIDPNGRVLEPLAEEHGYGKDTHLWTVGRINPFSFFCPVNEPWYRRWLPLGHQGPIDPVTLPVSELPVSRWHEFKKVQGVLTADMPIDRRVSLYARWGDWLPWSCWLLVGVGLVWGGVRGARSGLSL